MGDKKSTTSSEFTILVDNREKSEWTIPKKYPTSHVTLETGDYNVIKTPEDGELKSKYTDEDLDYLFCLERKSGPSEWAQNVVSSAFSRELKRMSVFRHKYILFESSIDDFIHYPVGSSIPKRRWKYLKIRGPFMISSIMSYSIKYNIMPIFAGNPKNAAYIATELMKKVYKEYLQN